MDWTKIILLLLVHLYIVQSSPYINHFRHKRRLCGSNLADALRLVCDGNYYSPKGKKSGTEPFKDFFDDSSYRYQYDENEPIIVGNEGMYLPLLPKEVVKSLIPYRVRKTPGVVNECCYKSCSMDHLRKYCG